MCLWKMQKTHTERQGVYKGLKEKKSFLQNEGMRLLWLVFLTCCKCCCSFVREMLFFWSSCKHARYHV